MTETFLLNDLNSPTTTSHIFLPNLTSDNTQGVSNIILIEGGFLGPPSCDHLKYDMKYDGARRHHATWTVSQLSDQSVSSRLNMGILIQFWTKDSWDEAS